MVTPSSSTSRRESTNLLKRLIPVSILALGVALLSCFYLNNNSIYLQKLGPISIKEMSALNGKNMQQSRLLILQEASFMESKTVRAVADSES